MASRQIKMSGQIKMPESTEDDSVELSLSQKKRPEAGRYLLQVDRQTKGSYATAEAAHTAGAVIKKGYPAVRVTVYDSVETVDTVIEPPATSSPLA